MMARDFVNNLQETLERHRNPEKAEPMAAYMKHHFSFLGLPRTDLDPLARPLIKEAKPFANEAFLRQSVLLLWQLPEREYQYVAINLLYTYSSKATDETLELIKQLVTHKSWWDSVDSLASLVGKLVWTFPHWKKTLDTYSTHENFWLRRIALLHQLNYKDKTDSKRLFRYCRTNAKEEEFFIRKAIGWALREYSKTNPDAVRAFLTENEDRLSSLSIREASKYL